MRIIIVVFLFAASILPGKSQSYSKEKFCEGLKQVVSLMNKQGDWLLSVKGDSAKSAYVFGDAFACKLQFTEALENRLVRNYWQEKDSARGSYTFSACFGRAKDFTEIAALYDELRSSVLACFPGTQPAEDLRGKYDEGDAYFRLAVNKTEISIRLYENIFAQKDKVILLNIAAVL